jgi:hypothetical protein
LYAYACKKELPIGEVIIDPRYQYVTRGVAAHWEDLNNHWAMNDTYGQQILSVYDKLVAFEYIPSVVEEQPKQDESVQELPPIEVKPTDPVEIPTNTEANNDKQYSFIKKIIDYIFSLLKELFNKK